MIRERADKWLYGEAWEGPEEVLARLREHAEDPSPLEDKLNLLAEAIRVKEELAQHTINSLRASLKKELTETGKRLRKLEGRLSLPAPQERDEPPTVAEIRVEMKMLRLAAEKTRAEVELFRKKLEERI